MTGTEHLHTRRAIVGGAVAAGVSALVAGCSSPAASPASATSADAPSSTPPTTATAARSTPTPSPSASAGFDMTRYSIDDPHSIWVVVDKKRPLQPKSWIPPDLVQPAVPHTNVPYLRKVAAEALERMFAGAKADGVVLVSLSAYRSYADQASIFARNVAQLGRATTLNLTAKPGYSEHQTGLADDIGDGTSADLQVAFESHPAAKWLLANSWRYGFIQRYPLGYTAITGIQVEPWHFRYVGTYLSKHLHTTGVKTLEQFFGLPDSPTY